MAGIKHELWDAFLVAVLAIVKAAASGQCSAAYRWGSLCATGRRVFNRELGNPAEDFSNSCYDATVRFQGYDESSGLPLFQALYLPQGKVYSWDVCQVQPGAPVEVQWRVEQRHPFGWWAGVVREVRTRSVIVEFQQLQLAASFSLALRALPCGDTGPTQPRSSGLPLGFGLGCLGLGCLGSFAPLRFLPFIALCSVSTDTGCINSHDSHSRDFIGNSYIDNSYIGNSYIDNSYIGNSYIDNSYIGNSYIGNSYIGNSYIDNSYIGNSYIDNSYIGNSYIDNSYIGNSYIDNSYIGNSYIGNSYIGNSYIDNSYIDNSYIDNSYIGNSYIDNSYIDNSYIDNSYIGNSYIDNSYIGNSYIGNSYIGNSYIDNSYIGNSYIDNSYIGNSYIDNSYIGNSYIGNSYIGNSYIGNSYIGNSYIGNSYIGNSYIDNSYIGNSYIGNSYIGNSYIGNSYIGNSYIGNSYIDNSYIGNSYIGNSYIDNSYIGNSYIGNSYIDNSYARTGATQPACVQVAHPMPLYPAHSPWRCVELPVERVKQVEVNEDVRFGYLGGLRLLSPVESQQWQAQHLAVPELQPALGSGHRPEPETVIRVQVGSWVSMRNSGGGEEAPWQGEASEGSGKDKTKQLQPSEFVDNGSGQSFGRQINRIATDTDCS
ncbi:hypothetical protein QJQ45_025523 [Haematococcus lacustris]|nr:hypothetical protein QJQ45_025523 [Haematococcus lacustris]